MSKPVIALSQSNLKELFKYQQLGHCGQAAMLKMFGVNSTSDAKELGNYFEFMATGSLPRNGKIPLPKRNKAKDPKEPGEPSADYRWMEEQAALWREWILQEYGLEFVVGNDGEPLIGFKLEIKDFKNTGREANGIVDAVMIATRDIVIYNYDIKGIKTSELKINKGEKVIVDLKSSGLTNDKYDHMGWHPATLNEREQLTIQPIHYKYLWREIYGEDIHFVWTVFSTDKRKPNFLFYANVSSDRLDQHEQSLIGASKLLVRFETGNIKPRPSFEKCMDCPFKTFLIPGQKEVTACPHKVSIPQFYKIDI